MKLAPYWLAFPFFSSLMVVSAMILHGCMSECLWVRVYGGGLWVWRLPQPPKGLLQMTQIPTSKHSRLFWRTGMGSSKNSSKMSCIWLIFISLIPQVLPTYMYIYIHEHAHTTLESWYKLIIYCIPASKLFKLPSHPTSLPPTAYRYTHVHTYTPGPWRHLFGQKKQQWSGRRFKWWWVHLRRTLTQVLPSSRTYSSKERLGHIKPMLLLTYSLSTKQHYCWGYSINMLVLYLFKTLQYFICFSVAIPCTSENWNYMSKVIYQTQGSMLVLHGTWQSSQGH